MYSSSIRPEELPQPFPIVVRGCMMTLADDCRSRSHGNPLKVSDRLGTVSSWA